MNFSETETAEPTNLVAIARTQPQSRSAVVNYGRMSWTLRGVYARIDNEPEFHLRSAEAGESIDDILEFLAEDVIADLSALALEEIEAEIEAEESGNEGWED